MRKYRTKAYATLNAFGLSDTDIARVCSVGVESVTKWRKLHHIPQVPNDQKRDISYLWQWIEELYFRGKTDRQIAWLMKIDVSVVEDWRRIMDLPPKWDEMTYDKSCDSESLFSDKEFLEEFLERPIKPC